MSRRWIVSLVIAHLLLCPFRCLGVLEGGAGDAGHVLPVCDCGACGHSPNTPNDLPARPPSENGCDSCQCVCDGAIIEKGALALTGPSDQFAPCPLPFSAMRTSAAELCETRVARLVEFSPGSISGRDLRHWLESLVC